MNSKYIDRAGLKFLLQELVNKLSNPAPSVGIGMNFELIFSGDANSTGTVYSVSKRITEFSAILFRTDLSTSSMNFCHPAFILIPRSEIAYGRSQDLTLYEASDNKISNGNRLIMHFNDYTYFTIDVLSKDEAFNRIGLRKIWGVL